jgi:spore germination protein YaaH
MLGVPTFGYEYEITPHVKGWNYKKIRSLSYQSAIELARNSSTTPIRNSAGELSFIYQMTSSSTILILGSSTPVMASSMRLVWFPDSVSTHAKIKLAKQFKLRGVAIFKADGESDPLMWGVLP